MIELHVAIEACQADRHKWFIHYLHLLSQGTGSLKLGPMAFAPWPSSSVRSAGFFEEDTQSELETYCFAGSMVVDTEWHGS